MTKRPLKSFETLGVSRAKHMFKRNSTAVVFFLQLSTVWKAHVERHKASRACGLGDWEQGPVLRMDRQQAPPWVHITLILFLLSLGGAIEIPMDREFCACFFLFYS